MRLPWPFNRPQRSAAAPSASSSVGVEVFGAAPRGPQAWRELPVLATSMGKPPLIAPTPPFKAELAGAAEAPIALAPLTHGHGLDAPTGLAHNLVRAIDQGRAADKHDWEARSALAPAHRRSRIDDAPPAATADDAPVAAPNAGPATTPTTDAAALTPRLATASMPMAATASFVRADRQATLPSLPVGKIGSARLAGATQRAPLASSVAPEPAAAARVPAATLPAAATTPSISGTPSGERLTLGQSRRRGLGAPMDTATLTTLGQPLAVQPPTTEPMPPLPLAVYPATAEVPSRESKASSVPAQTSPDPIPGSAVIARQSVSATSPAARTMAAPLHQRPPRTAPASSASTPTLGARPIVGRVQRAPLSGSGATGSASPSAVSSGSTGAGPVRIHRGSAAEEMAGALDARAFTNAGEIYLPDRHGPLGGSKARSLLAHEMTHVSQQRSMGSGLPHEDSALGRQLEAQAVAAETTSDLPLATSAARTTSPASTKQSDTQLMPAPEKAISSASGPSSPDHAQRAPSAKDAVWSNPDDEFRDKLRSNEDELFATFERRLRHVLLHERERGGTLIDAL